MNKITVHLGEQGYLATFSGPHATEIIASFDTATLPLPFTSRAPLATVLATVRAGHPLATVQHFGE